MAGKRWKLGLKVMHKWHRLSTGTVEVISLHCSRYLPDRPFRGLPYHSRYGFRGPKSFEEYVTNHFKKKFLKINLLTFSIFPQFGLCFHVIVWFWPRCFWLSRSYRSDVSWFLDDSRDCCDTYDREKSFMLRALHDSAYRRSAQEVYV